MPGHRIRPRRAIALLGLALALSPTLTGCASRRSSYRPIAVNEPPIEGDPAAVAAAPSPRTVTWADRHPLLTKPREYYDTSGDNKLVKTAAATFIGIPAGFLGEMRQIVTGQPAPRY